MAIFRFVFFAFSLAFIEANDVAENQIAGRPCTTFPIPLMKPLNQCNSLFTPFLLYVGNVVNA